MTDAFPACGEPINIGGKSYNRVKRRHLRVVVENNGTLVAKGCTGTIELETRLTNCEPFSGEPKTLRWVSPTGEIATKADIAPFGGKQLLDVVFYDECGYIDMPKMKCEMSQKPQLRAFAADPTAYKYPWFHLQDGFCQGKFRLRLTVYSENAKPIWRYFVLTVTDDWQQLMMEVDKEYSRKG